jgi:uncharacterized protein YidB (DUF937 family)
MSGFLGQLLGSLGGQREGGQSPLIGILQQVLAENGGVSGLVSRFQGAGLGQQVQSWLSNGTNQPISPEQVDQVFSPNEIENWANRLGVSVDRMRGVLAEVLPHAVDHSTPTGQPSEGQNIDLSALLGRFLGR